MLGHDHGLIPPDVRLRHLASLRENRRWNPVPGLPQFDTVARTDDGELPPPTTRANPTRPAGLARELVVARYREDVGWVEACPADTFVTVYNKGPAALDLPPRVLITPLANRGREGRTWLDHILRYWDDLAAWTFFAQGEPHQDPAAYLDRLRVDYADTTSLTSQYKPDFPPRWITDQDAVEWHADHEVRYGRAIYQGGRRPERNEPWLREVWSRFIAAPAPDPLRTWTYGYGAMYAVPRHRIRARPRSFWEYCHAAIALPENEPEQTWGSGYAFELLWRYLFGDHRLYPVVATEPPGLWTQARSFAAAVAAQVAAGNPPANEATRATREAACRGCEHHDAAQDLCRRCGCSLPLKRSWLTSSCPVGKW